MFPDLGHVLQQQGVSEQVLHRFYDVSLSHISIADDGILTTILNTEYGDREVAAY